METPKGFWEGKNYLHLYLSPSLQLIPFTTQMEKASRGKNKWTNSWIAFWWGDEFICFRTALYKVLEEFCLPPGKQVLYTAVIQVSQPLFNNFIKAAPGKRQCWNYWPFSHIGHCCLFPSLCYMQPCPICTGSYGLKSIQSLQKIEVNWNGGLHLYNYGRVIVTLVRCFGSVCFEVAYTPVSNPSPVFCMQA